MAQRRGKLGAPILSQIVRVLELAPYNLTAADALLWGSRLNWAVPRLTALGQAITENAAGRSITDWLNIANHLPDREADVTVFARTPTWAADRLAALAQLFAAQAGGRSAADWAAIAAPLRDQEANVATFARTPNWAVADLVSLAQNRANYTQLRQLIMPLAVPVKTSALGNQALLTFLNASLPWDDFAKTVELLGRQIPDYATLVTNPTVRGQLQQAWVDSQPGQNPPLVNQHEEGGWIYLNIISGALTAIRQVAGATAEIDLSAPPVL